jgi:hypothetical protein
MQALRMSASQALMLCMNKSMMFNPEFLQALAEELEEDDDA